MAAPACMEPEGSSTHGRRVASALWAHGSSWLSRDFSSLVVLARRRGRQAGSNRPAREVSHPGSNVLSAQQDQHRLPVGRGPNEAVLAEPLAEARRCGEIKPDHQTAVLWRPLARRVCSASRLMPQSEPVEIGDQPGFCRVVFSVRLCFTVGIPRREYGRRLNRVRSVERGEPCIGPANPQHHRPLAPYPVFGCEVGFDGGRRNS